MDVVIERMDRDHWDAVRSIYEAGIATGPDARGKGVGTALLAALVESSEEAGLWTLQAGIFPENVPSLRIHEACGFRRVGVRERLGKLDGRWRDVVLMERRSEVVGTESRFDAATSG